MNSTPSSLPPVPAPLRRRWREFRIEVLPWVAFAMLAGVVGFLWEDIILPHPVAIVQPDPPPADPMPDSAENGTACAIGQVHPALLTLTNSVNGTDPTRD